MFVSLLFGFLLRGPTVEFFCRPPRLFTFQSSGDWLSRKPISTVAHKRCPRKAHRSIYFLGATIPYFFNKNMEAHSAGFDFACSGLPLSGYGGRVETWWRRVGRRTQSCSTLAAIRVIQRDMSRNSRNRTSSLQTGEINYGIISSQSASGTPINLSV
jgi:hypothetical protein